MTGSADAARAGAGYPLPLTADGVTAAWLSAALRTRYPGVTVAAVDRLKESGARRIKFICILGSEPGARAFAEVHPDVPVFAAAIDAKLNDHGYIVPGLGDAGDRLTQHRTERCLCA